ncbi:phage major capsid protein [Vibrio maritimus]|uniref:Phage major capsid protein n=1 Tax=Vibrio maritimus TaxID=990268 RepID=A0A090RVG3_9VIBR|nr:phage major capsid protein [Vibrio maritimus]
MGDEVVLEKLEEISVKQNKKTDELKTNVDKLETKYNEQVEANAELKEQNDDLAARVKDLEQKGALPQGGAVETKSLGQQFADSPEFKKAMESKVSGIVEIKAPTGNVGTTDAQTYSQRIAGVIPLPQEAPTVYAALPKSRATSNSIDYVKEETFVSNVDEVAEKGALPLSTTEYVTVNTPVVNAGHHIKITEQMLQDNVAVASLIDTRMGQKVLQKINNLVVMGSGTMKV